MLESHIFLAHANEDKPQVRQLYNKLKECGFLPWLDEVDLIAGQNWREEIPRAIRSAAVCLACLSKSSVSKRSYVQREFRYALSALAELPVGSTFLIPVRLDDCEVPDLQLSELGLKLPDLQWVNLYERDGFRKLIKAVRNAGAKKRTFLSFEVFRDIDEPWCPEMVMIPTGRFLMGSPESEPGRKDNEGPQHNVKLTIPFALGRYAVTFDEYDYFCAKTYRKKPEDGKGGRNNNPVVNISPEDAASYCNWLSKLTGMIYALPTEAMWEYACRAGTTTPYSFGDTVDRTQANFFDVLHDPIKDKMAAPVGSFEANSWGLSEMHGNVWEICADGLREYAVDDVRDPIGASRRKFYPPPPSFEIAVRGGSWVQTEDAIRSAARNKIRSRGQNADIGFRCARLLKPAR